MLDRAFRQTERVISFHQLIGSGGKDGARETFERLIAQLVHLRYGSVGKVEVRKVEANPGDDGLDVLVGELDGVVSVWQSKFFIDGVDKAQQSQIRKSLNRLLSEARAKGFRVDVWTLCVPVDLDPKNLKWWQGWRTRQQKATGVKIELWDRTQLEALLISPDAAHIREIYFPTGSAGSEPPLAVADVPDGISYDHMLFIKQLAAAEIHEHDSAKQQFFNAELLGREVADKQIPKQMQALQAEHADLWSMWEDRFNNACNSAGADLLPDLHPEVMKAIEARHAAGAATGLPMHLVHRKGAMHQVVDEGRAGWTRGFREIAGNHND